MSELEKRVEERFGVLPNFFRLAPETPEIIEKLWGFAQAAYLDNPLPSAFKERLFVHLSRFCPVRYCIGRHVGFLVGLGRPAGDPAVGTQSVADVVKLLRRPFPRGQELQSRLALCEACSAPIVEVPMADTEMEDPIFVLAAHVFLKTSDFSLCLDALARLFGPSPTFPSDGDKFTAGVLKEKRFELRKTVGIAQAAPLGSDGRFAPGRISARRREGSLSFRRTLPAASRLTRHF